MTDAERKTLYDTLVNLTAMRFPIQSAATAITKIDQSITRSDGDVEVFQTLRHQ
jgi:hypothetical protein